MAKSLKEAGFNPTIPEGGYFMLGDFSKIYDKLGSDVEKETGSKDYKFVKYMSKVKKLQGIPPSAFYSQDHKPLAQNYVRYCFMKKDETLDGAKKILDSLKN